MDKKILIVVLVLIVLLVIVFISFKFTKPSREVQKELLDNAEILIVDNKEEKIINIDDIKSAGEETFEAVLDTSSTKATLHAYNGTQLRKLFVYLGISIESKDVIVISGVDTFAVAYSGEEVLKDDNIYIAFMEDGEFLGTMSNGGTGPFESIIKSDQFSNRRCKWITKIEVRR